MMTFLRWPILAHADPTPLSDRNVRERRARHLGMSAAADRAEGRRRKDRGRVKDLAEQARLFAANNDTKLIVTICIDNYIYS